MPYKKQKKEDSFDDARGSNSMNGWWISEKQAAKYSVGGVAWWKATLDGKMVEMKQFDENGPLSKPIWRYENGDMYLGEWARRNPTECSHASTASDRQRDEGTMVEHGFGVTYNQYPAKLNGLVHVGGWKDGFRHGLGQSTWMENSNTWKKNILPASVIYKYQRREDGGKKKIPYPFSYLGKYEGSKKSDKRALVELKDGTARRGEWKSDGPVGDWWEQHENVPATSTPAARAMVQNISPSRLPYTAPEYSAINSRFEGKSSSNCKMGGSINQGSGPLIKPRGGLKRTGESDSDYEAEGVGDFLQHHDRERRREAKYSSTKTTQKKDDVDSVVPDNSSDFAFDLISAETETKETPAKHSLQSTSTPPLREKVVKQIEEWLIPIFGGVISEHIQMYANKFYELGAYPPEKFVEVCKAGDIEEFDWMLRWHQKIFKKWFNQRNSETLE